MAEPSQSYVGRLAPSPTGALHLGNARSFLLTWLHAKQHDGKLILRIEDLHMSRVKAGAVEQIFDDLNWLGITWHEGPKTTSEALDSPHLQSQNLQRYQNILENLIQQGLAYPCSCSRRDIAMAQSAPHGHELRYPGTCRQRWPDAAAARQFSGREPSWRFLTDESISRFFDLCQGQQSSKLSEWSGDFVIAQGFNKVGYQLAVCIDDHDQGVSHVLRGDDLLPSTHRQISIYKRLGWTIPNFGHLPLLVGSDGRRLAKRHGDWKISTLRQQRHQPEDVIGLIAYTLGLLPKPKQPMSLGAFETSFRWEALSPEPFQLPAELAKLYGVT
jgi:glutamyl-tRNA synthetase